MRDVLLVAVDGDQAEAGWEGMDVLLLGCSKIGIKLSFLHTEASTRDASPETVGHLQWTGAKGACKRQVSSAVKMNIG